ncbi:MAG: hypothetical protein FJ104_07890 [Deltaproteobacteria bacterium]|nr:hypothetical protein [Deltaproteobacteria bacterium]
MLFVCGRASCRAGARRAAPALERAGVATRVEYREGAGHRYDGAVGEALAEAVGWLTGGAPPTAR